MTFTYSGAISFSNPLLFNNHKVVIQQFLPELADGLRNVYSCTVKVIISDCSSKMSLNVKLYGSSVVRQRWVCSLIGLKITCLIREVSSAGFTRSVTQTWWSSDTNADNTWLWKKPLNDSRANFYCGVYFVMDRCDACLGLIVRFVVLCGFCEVCCYKNYKCTCFTLRSAGVKYFTGDQPVSSHLCVGCQKRRHLLVV